MNSNLLIQELFQELHLVHNFSNKSFIVFQISTMTIQLKVYHRRHHFHAAKITLAESLHQNWPKPAGVSFHKLAVSTDTCKTGGQRLSDNSGWHFQVVLVYWLTRWSANNSCPLRVSTNPMWESTRVSFPFNPLNPKNSNFDVWTHGEKEKRSERAICCYTNLHAHHGTSRIGYTILLPCRWRSAWVYFLKSELGELKRSPKQLCWN